MALQYFLTIDGIDGGSKVKGHEGAFEISGYDFDVSNLIKAVGGGGASGKVDFSPLTVELDLGGGLTDLLSVVASGKHLPSIRLEGVTPGEGGQTVYDLKLGNATVNGLHDSEGTDKVSFDFSKISLTTTEQKADGSRGESETFSFDIDANKAGASIPDPRPEVSNEASASAQPLTPADDNQPVPPVGAEADTGTNAASAVGLAELFKDAALAVVPADPLVDPVEAAVLELGDLFDKLGSEVALNPQPLPPAELFGLGDEVSLNPQPLPPAELFNEVAETGIIIVGGTPEDEAAFNVEEFAFETNFANEFAQAASQVTELPAFFEQEVFADFNLG